LHGLPVDVQDGNEKHEFKIKNLKKCLQTE